jgi:hypothetical protein
MSVEIKPSNEVGGVMNIACHHASKFGNGALAAAEVKKIMAARGVTVSARHIPDARPGHPAAAGLHVVGSPGRIGNPQGNARRFLRTVRLEPGTRYAILTTPGAPRPDKKTGPRPPPEEQDRGERVIPIMNELLEATGLTKVAAAPALVTGINGPLQGRPADQGHRPRRPDHAHRGHPARPTGTYTRCPQAGPCRPEADRRGRRRTRA